MEPVRFADGFDGPDRVAFGLAAGSLGVVAGGLALAYLVLHSPLPGPVAGGCAALIVGAAAGIGWGRWADRPALDWGLAAGRFVAGPARLAVDVAPLAEPVPEPEPPRGLPRELHDGVPTGVRGGFAEPQGHAVGPTHGGSEAWMRWLACDQAGGKDEPVAPEEASSGPGPAPEGGRREPAEPGRLDDAMVDWVHRRVRRPDGTASAAPAARSAVPLVVLAGRDRDRTATPRASMLAPDGGDVVHAQGVRLAHHPDRGVDTTGRPRGGTRRARRITFFALSGGVGRTTLAVEVSALLAARGRPLDPHRSGPPRVAYLDLDHLASAAALRLGTRTPAGQREQGPAGAPRLLAAHRSGLLPAVMDTSGAALDEPPSPSAAAAMLHRLESEGAELVVIDCNATPAALSTWVLEAADAIYVVVGDSARGVQEAYRARATLRRLGHAGKLAFVVNQSSGRVDFGPTMADLGGSLLGVVPRDPAVPDAEDSHRILCLEGEGPAATALRGLAAAIHPLALAVPADGQRAGAARPRGAGMQSSLGAHQRRPAPVLPAAGAV